MTDNRAVIDLESAPSIADPTGYFEAARADGSVQWSDAHRAWVVLDHHDVADAFRDGERLSTDRITPLERIARDKPAAFGRVVELLRGWMIFRDPPEHTRLRDPVRNVFTPRRVDDLEGLVADVVAEVVDGLPDHGEIDVRRDFAGPLPALVIAAILGVDRDQRAAFQAWSDDLTTVVFSTDPRSTAGDEAIAATDHFAEFFGELIDRERAAPSDSLLGRLIADTAEDFTQLELVGACTLMLFAGHETTTSLLSNTFGLMADRPEVEAALRACGTAPAMAIAVEELMRMAGPARTMFRKALVDHRRGGRSVRAGDTVALCIAAANHDPAVFDQPERFDAGRDPNPHLGFGWGLHHCVGAHLARLEARLALRAFFDRYATIDPIGPPPPLRGTVLGFARDSLTIRV